ncbi:AAA-domain-containing protein [Agrocybe pediades]|nr:AAA-domain-containing protein [Agrocybe pediades]
MHTRRSTRRQSSLASGSEYHASEKSEMDMQDDIPPQEEEPPPPEFTTTSRGRKIQKKKYAESSDNEDDDQPHPPAAQELFDESKTSRVTRASSRQRMSPDDDDEDEGGPRRYPLRRRVSKLPDFIVSDEDEKLHSGNTRYNTRRLTRKSANTSAPKKDTRVEDQRTQRSQRLTRRSARASGPEEKDFDPNEHTSSGASADADGSDDNEPSDLDDLALEPEPEREPEPEDEGDGRPYSLRERKKIDYTIPPPLEEMAKPPPRQPNMKSGGRFGSNAGRGKSRLGWSATGKELGRWMGMPQDDSDSDVPTRTPRKPFGAIGGFGAGAVAGGGMLNGDLAAGGTPSNLGKIGDAALADADPLGVNQNVTFDEVGGLDDHIHALKEMTLLPLLYPEVFQRFNVTPPRGVLFHGPPGTGKTLLARALAASCRSGGRQISFFMRKGADCLSKWVGEAERQLRLLFEEARNSQPSIIFFDEIDGLAPVRSSKQDQIHASIVSTLLALMDGMDGRGQVVVIGATNRPDAVDPALRRPGRFDREFYFGLPGLDAREKILTIMTKKWEGWGSDADTPVEKQLEVKERIKGLAKLTKGYGGADLRALCTEAALNAIQRRYPQVYKSDDRLLLKPETIGVGLRDFMISIKKLVPSSARSTTSAATPLPVQFVPLLENALEKVKEVVHRVMPIEKKLSALEEAEFEDEGGEEGALEREMLSQAMQTLRVYRPRVIIHGPVGMGQGYIGAATLHHLEGYHVQSLELGSLMTDSTRTVEAAIVQLFVEAKRNQPSVIYIPSLVGWCAAVSETARSTVRAMLDTLAPTDPILLLAVVDGRFMDLPRDVRAWFGPTKDNRVELTNPSEDEREAFFEGVVKDVERPPNQFADGMERRKRVLEKLPIAPPLEPRKPTAAELALQEENDQRILTLLKYRLGPILTELKRKFKRFTKRAAEEYNFNFEGDGMNGLDTVNVTAIHVEQGPNGVDPTAAATAGDEGVPMNGVVMEQQQIMQQMPPLFDMDLERMQNELFKGRYLTPRDFLEDVEKILHNAEVRAHEDPERLHKAQAMFTATEVSIQEFDPQLRLECERMAGRERQRREERKKAKEKAKEKTNGAAPPAGARRSARTNGLQPEHAITDPVKLERRLKRQRGEESSGADSHGSENEVNGTIDVDGRDSKRTRIIEELDDDRDPLDTLASSRPGSEGRTHIVRFAPSIQVDPMAPLVGPAGPSHLPQQPQYFSNSPQPPMFPEYNNQYNQYLSSIPHLNVQQNHFHPTSQSSPFVSQTPPQDQMIVDQVPRSSGFDPSLLNPILPDMRNGYHASPTAHGVNGTPYNFPVPSADPSDPFFVPGLSPAVQNPQMLYPQQAPKTPTPPLSRTPVPQPNFTNGLERVATPTRTPLVSAMREVTPMVIERDPTPAPTPPPLPDFHVSPSLVSNLRQLLKSKTGRLNIEQLEQLRATCLGTVWRHRKEWDRDELVKELLRDVKDFIAEVEEDAEYDSN